MHERETPPLGTGGAAFFNSTGRLLAYPTVEGAKVWDAQEAREVGAFAGEDVLPVGFDAQDGSLLAVGPKGFLRGPIRESSPGGPINLGPPTLVHERKLRGGWASADGKFCLVA